MSAHSFIYEGVRRIHVVNFGEGSIVFEAGPDEQAVEGTISAPEAVLAAVEIRQDHDRLRVDGAAQGWRSTPVQLRFGVPPGLDYEISSGRADIRVEPEAGRVRAKSGSGDISLGVTHDVQCTTGSGDLTVAEVRGDAAHVSSGSGDIQIGEAFCQLVAKSGSGDVRVRALHRVPLQASSGSGDISVPWAGGSLELRSASGAITVGVADGLPAWLDLHSVSGDVRIAMDATEPPAPGEAYVSIKARTASGDIAIYRA
jgi:pantoate kinase